MNNNEILLKESNKCLLCKIPKCKANCPISTDIPRIIELYINNKILEAGKILFKNNPLSLICSIVCYHEEQCLGNCVLNFKNNPVEFYKIENYISSKYLYENTFKKEKSINKRVCIIGSGPSGLSMAFFLCDLGYDVTIFEKNSSLGGVLRYGIPEFRLKKNILEKIEEILLNLNVKFRYNVLIGPSITIDKLFYDGYDAVFIGTGLWEAKSLNIKGETLGHVHYAIDYLVSPTSYKLGKNVVIIGGGNVAMDAARTAKRNGSNVTIVYRKDFEHMSASKGELEETKIDGIKFKLLKSPIEITNNSIKFCEIQKNISEDGKYKFVPNYDKTYNIDADSVIIAVSQGPRKNIISTCPELKTNENGLLICDEFGLTTKKGVFAAGDVVSGPKTVVNAVNNSKLVSKSIHEYLTNHV